MDVKHFSHNHALVFHQVPQGSKIHCSGCKSPGSGNIYACWQCGHFLHEQCYHAKRFLDHPSHTLHPLTLVPYPTYQSGKFVCKSCNLEGNGLCYTCSKCQFDMHVQCALLPNSNAQISSFPIWNDAHNYTTHLQSPIQPPYANQNYRYPPIQNNVYPNFPHYSSNNQNNHFRPSYTQQNTPTPNYTPPVNSPYPNPLPQPTTGAANNQSIQFSSYTQSNNTPSNSNPTVHASYPNPPPQPTSTNSTAVNYTTTNNPPPPSPPPPPYYPSAESQSTNNPPHNTQNCIPHSHNHAYPPTQNNVYPNFPHNAGTSGSNNQNNQFYPAYIQSITPTPNNSPSLNSPYPNPPPQPTTGIDDTNKQNNFPSPHPLPNTPTPEDNTTVNTLYPNHPPQPTGTSPTYSTVVNANTTTNNPPPTPNYNPQVNSPYSNPPPQPIIDGSNNQSIQFPSYTLPNKPMLNSNPTNDVPYPNLSPQTTPTSSTAVNSITTTENPPPSLPSYYPTAEQQNSNNQPYANNTQKFIPHSQNHIYLPTHNNVSSSFPHDVETSGSNNQNNQFPPPYIQSNIPMPYYNSPAINSPYPNPSPQPTTEIDASNKQNNQFPSPNPQPNTPTPNDNITVNAPYPNPPPQPIPTIPTYSTVANANTTINNPPPQYYPTTEPQTTNNPQSEPPSIIQHFSHPHSLKQLEINKKAGKICSACDIKLSGSSFLCTEPYCTFNLHKTCFDSPQEIHHKSHPSHPLKLITTTTYNDGTFTCNACRKDGKGFSYSCATCSYDLHMDCVSLPKKMTQPDHKHTLTLYYSSPAGKDATFFCDVCNESVHESAWMYYCCRCDFGTHLECVESEIKQETVLSSVASDMDELYATAISGRIAAHTQQAALDLWD